jgi:hypothetical protein
MNAALRIARGLIAAFGAALILAACLLGYFLAIPSTSTLGLFYDLVIFAAAAIVVGVGMLLIWLARRRPPKGVQQ